MEWWHWVYIQGNDSNPLPSTSPRYTGWFPEKSSYFEAKLAEVTCHVSVTPIVSLIQSQNIFN